MAVINTNISATIAQNSLVKNERMMSKAMEQLSTGRRINSAADDAAGIGISSVMTAQIKGLNQAVRNSNDAISMLQVADGAYSEIENMLQRMNELAVQTASDTYTDAQRANAQLEFQALASQIESIGSSTTWNGSALLDGTVGDAGTVTFHVGAKSTDTLNHSFSQVSGGAVTAAAGAVTEKTAGGVAAQQVLEVDLSGNDDAAGDYNVSVTVNGSTFNIAYTATAANTLSSTISIDGVSGTSLTVVPEDSADSGALTIEVVANTLTITAAENGAGTMTFEGTALFSDGTAAAGIYSDVASLDISTQAGATAAIAAISSGASSVLDDVSDARASLGAVMNRLESVVDNLSTEAANTTAARSRIVDTDYATATTELARTQIIQQAGTAMLAQANQLPQTVLSLLQ